jgi:hypothetical protein
LCPRFIVPSHLIPGRCESAGQCLPTSDFPISADSNLASQTKQHSAIEVAPLVVVEDTQFQFDNSDEEEVAGTPPAAPRTAIVSPQVRSMVPCLHVHRSCSTDDACQRKVGSQDSRAPCQPPQAGSKGSDIFIADLQNYQPLSDFMHEAARPTVTYGLQFSSSLPHF